jgi:hypothetical protein
MLIKGAEPVGSAQGERETEIEALWSFKTQKLPGCSPLTLSPTCSRARESLNGF